MDVLELLKTNWDDITVDDLVMFQNELKFGNFSADYIKECNVLIDKKNYELSTISVDKESEFIDFVEDEDDDDFMISYQDTSVIIPYDLLTGKANSGTKEKTSIMDKIIIRRNKNDSRTVISHYVENGSINEVFIEQNYNQFIAEEISVLLELYQFSEEFLEKHFSTLNHYALAKYQRFSESFYIKHFNELDTTQVLTFGVNEWKKKENRSAKLSTFLRLRGVKL